MSYGLRVFCVLPDGSPSVANRATLALMASLPVHDIEPVACFLGEGPLSAVCRDEMGIETVLMAAGRGARPLTGRAARAAVEPLVRGARPHLVHSVDAVAHAIAGPVARRVGVRAVWSQFGLASLGDLRQLAAAVAPAARVIAASSIIATRQHRVNPRRTRIDVLPPGVRVPDDPADVRMARARRTLGLTPDDLVAGWIADQGSADTALRAAASLCHARARARLLVVEDPSAPDGSPRADGLREKAATLGIGDRLRFAPPGPVVGAPPALDACDLVFLTFARPAPVALAPLEVMAAGVALVAEDHETLREYATAGHDAVFVPTGDHEALAATLLSLGDAPERRVRLAEAGGATARGRFAIETVTERLAVLHREVAGRDPRPPIPGP